VGAVCALRDLLSLREQLRQAGQKVVFTNGCFDLLHVGHVRYLAQAKALGNVLVVGLNTDNSTRQLKGAGRPVVPEADRAEVLCALNSVDYVVLFDDLTAERLVQALRPDIYVKGGDYAARPGESGKDLPEARIVAEYAGRVVLLPLVAGRSTSGVLETIVERFCPRRPP
jgi:rfaE bifunctional protein nucleotidyltransferase chain/domain